MPAAASTAGGPYMGHTRNNCMSVFIPFSHKLILLAFDDVLIQLCGGLKETNVATVALTNTNFKNFSIICKEIEWCLHVEHIKTSTKNSRNIPVT